MNKYLVSVFVILLVLINIALIPSKGTGDVLNWIRIIDKVNNSQVDEIFPGCLNYDCGVFYPLTYPPGHFFLIYVVAVFSQATSLSPLISFKFSIFLFYLLGLITALLAFRILKKIPVDPSVLLHVTAIYLFSFSLMLNTQILGYTDIYFLPLLLASFILLVKGNVIASGVFFASANLIKWQPVILLPLYAAFLLRNPLKRNKILFFLAGILLPVIAAWVLNPGLLNALVFSFIEGALKNKFLSAAPNIPWVMGEIMQSAGLAQGRTLSENGYAFVFLSSGNPYSIYYIIPKIIFGAAYFQLLSWFYRFLKRGEKGATETFLRIIVVVFTLYFVTASGVHENHLASALFFCIVLATLYPSRRNMLLFSYVETYNFISLFVFYGFNGFTPLYNGLFGLNYALIAGVVFTFSFFCFLPFIIRE